MKKIVILFVVSFMLVSCSATSQSEISSLNTEKTTDQATENMIYLDVRTDEEWAAGHVKNAIHIPLSDIQNGVNLDKIPKDVPVQVYCRSGNRSGQAIKILSEKYGFTNLVNAGAISDLKGVEIVK